MDSIVSAKCIKCDSDAKHRCGNCGLVKYCGKECQTTHWPEHKKICSSLVSSTISIEDDICTIYLRSKAAILSFEANQPVILFGYVDALNSEYDQLSSSNKWDHQLIPKKVEAIYADNLSGVKDIKLDKVSVNEMAKQLYITKTKAKVMNIILLKDATRIVATNVDRSNMSHFRNFVKLAENIRAEIDAHIF